MILYITIIKVIEFRSREFVNDHRLYDSNQNF